MFPEWLKPIERLFRRYHQETICSRADRNARLRRAFGFGGLTKTSKNIFRSRSESTSVSCRVMASCVACVNAVKQKSVRLLRSNAAALSTNFLVWASTRKPRREPRVRRFSELTGVEFLATTFPPGWFSFNHCTSTGITIQVVRAARGSHDLQLSVVLSNLISDSTANLR